MADIEELKKLSPEERLRRLKELEKKRKVEIEEAQKLMKQSEAELDQQRKLQEKIPIPQLISEQMETLTTGEEREMFRSHRFLGRRAEQERRKRPKTKEETLEETLEKEAPRREMPTERAYGAILELSQKPVEYFASVFQEFEQKMYDAGGMENLPKEDRLHFEYASRGWDKKLEDIEAGRYEPTKEAFKETVLTERIRDKLQSMYRSQASGEALTKLDHEFKEFEEEPKYQ